MELAFTGLHQLNAPMLDHDASLPVPRQEAPGTAFGLNADPVPDQFLVGPAVLGLQPARSRRLSGLTGSEQ